MLFQKHFGVSLCEAPMYNRSYFAELGSIPSAGEKGREYWEQNHS